MLGLRLYFAGNHQTHECQYDAFEKSMILVQVNVQTAISSLGHHEISKVVLSEQNGLLSYLIFDD